MEKIKWNKKHIQLNQEREKRGKKKQQTNLKTSMTALLIQSHQ